MYVVRWCVLGAAVAPHTGKIIKNSLNVFEKRRKFATK